MTINVYRENYLVQFILTFIEYMLYFLLFVHDLNDLLIKNKYIGGGFVFLFYYVVYGIIVPFVSGGRTPLMLALGIHIIDRKNKKPSCFLIVLRGVFYPVVVGVAVYVTFIAGLWVKDWPFDVIFGTQMVRINKSGKPVYARRTFEAEL